MRCIEAERWISVRVDGERLPPGKEAALDEHLAGCSACRDLLALESRRSEALAKALGGSPDRIEEVGRAILLAAGKPAGARMAETASLSWMRPGPVRIVLSLAATVLVAAGLIWLLLPARNAPRGPEVARTPETAVPALLTHPILERESYDARLVPAPNGEPLRKSTLTRQWIVNLPMGEERSGQLIIERAGDRYVRLANWSYR